MKENQRRASYQFVRVQKVNRLQNKVEEIPTDEKTNKSLASLEICTTPSPVIPLRYTYLKCYFLFYSSTVWKHLSVIRICLHLKMCVLCLFCLMLNENVFFYVDCKLKRLQ